MLKLLPPMLADSVTQPEGDDPSEKPPLTVTGGFTVMTVPCVREITSGLLTLPVGVRNAAFAVTVGDAVGEAVAIATDAGVMP